MLRKKSQSPVQTGTGKRGDREGQENGKRLQTILK